MPTKTKSQKALETLVERLTRTIARSSIQYNLLEKGDKILVAVSGGKDSYGLLTLLNHLKKRLPFPIELVALHVAQGQPGMDATPLEQWLQKSGIPFEIAKEDTYSVVKRNIEPGQTACSVCARMRRGIIYTRAQQLGCNKIALGHHREDTLATLMMNLFYSGKLQAMPAVYTTDDGRFQVIRPLIEVAEGDMIALSEMMAFPIVPCYLCSGQEDHRRKWAGDLLNQIEKDHPRLKQVMLGALKNVKPSHLLDPTIKRIDKNKK